VAHELNSKDVVCMSHDELRESGHWPASTSFSPQRQLEFPILFRRRSLPIEVDEVHRIYLETR